MNFAIYTQHTSNKVRESNNFVGVSLKLKKNTCKICCGNLMLGFINLRLQHISYFFKVLKTLWVSYLKDVKLGPQLPPDILLSGLFSREINAILVYAMCLHEAGYDKRWQTEMKIARSTVLLHSAKTQTKLLGRRLPNHNVFWKQKIIKFFCKQTNNIQISTIKLLKTLSPFELTWPPRKQPSYLWMLLVGMQKKLVIFCFHTTLWLDNLLPRAPVWVSAQ